MSTRLIAGQPILDGKFEVHLITIKGQPQMFVYVKTPDGLEFAVDHVGARGLAEGLLKAVAILEKESS